MNKAHTMINWEDYPSINTPLAARILNKNDVALDLVDDRVVELDANKAGKTEIATLVADVKYDEATGIFTVTKKNGSMLTIDTKLEKLAINFEYDKNTEQLIITLDDGTKQYIDLSALITQYEFMDTDTVIFTIDSDGKVSAALKEGSISEKYLEPNYLAKVKVEVARAQSSADAAAVSEVNAEKSAKAAAVSEKNAKASENTVHADTELAKNYAEQTNTAKTEAESARDKAQTAQLEAQASAESSSSDAAIAKEMATSASASSQAAELSKQSAMASATEASLNAQKSQQYAVGKNNSSKYYYEQAKAISEGFTGALRPMGTTTFSQLPIVSSATAGDMYNISDEFVTTADFKEGAGKTQSAGTNVYKTVDGYWDCLAGTPVTGIKGAKETTFRRGNVNITASDVGAVADDGDASNTTVVFTEATARANISTGEKLSVLFGKVKKWFSDLKPHAFKDTVNNLTTTATGSALDATQGKVLNEAIADNANDITTLNNNLLRAWVNSEANYVSPQDVNIDTWTANCITWLNAYTDKPLGTLPTNNIHALFINNRGLEQVWIDATTIYFRNRDSTSLAWSQWYDLGKQSISKGSITYPDQSLFKMGSGANILSYNKNMATLTITVLNYGDAVTSWTHVATLSVKPTQTTYINALADNGINIMIDTSGKVFARKKGTITELAETVSFLIA
jgi:hypothetical protein